MLKGKVSLLESTGMKNTIKRLSELVDVYIESKFISRYPTDKRSLIINPYFAGDMCYSEIWGSTNVEDQKELSVDMATITNGTFYNDNGFLSRLSRRSLLLNARYICAFAGTDIYSPDFSDNYLLGEFYNSLYRKLVFIIDSFNNLVIFNSAFGLSELGFRRTATAWYETLGDGRSAKYHGDEVVPREGQVTTFPVDIIREWISKFPDDMGKNIEVKISKKVYIPSIELPMGLIKNEIDKNAKRVVRKEVMLMRKTIDSLSEVYSAMVSDLRNKYDEWKSKFSEAITAKLANVLRKSDGIKRSGSDIFLHFAVNIVPNKVKIFNKFYTLTEPVSKFKIRGLYISFQEPTRYVYTDTYFDKSVVATLHPNVSASGTVCLGDIFDNREREAKSEFYDNTEAFLAELIDLLKVVNYDSAYRSDEFPIDTESAEKTIANMMEALPVKEDSIKGVWHASGV